MQIIFICEKFVKWYSFYYIVKQGLKEGLSSWWEHTKEIFKKSELHVINFHLSDLIQKITKYLENSYLVAIVPGLSATNTWKDRGRKKLLQNVKGNVS